MRYRTGNNLPVTIVHDEYRSVVWADELSTRVMRLAESSETGIRHVTATRAVSRVELADNLLAIFGAAATYCAESRHQRSAPHIGHVELASIYRGQWCDPLASVLDSANRYGEVLSD